MVSLRPKEALDPMWGRGRLHSRVGERPKNEEDVPAGSPGLPASRGLDLGQAHHSPKNGQWSTFQLPSPTWLSKGQPVYLHVEKPSEKEPGGPGQQRPGLLMPFNNRNKNFLRAYCVQSLGVGEQLRKVVRSITEHFLIFLFSEILEYPEYLLSVGPYVNW